MKQIFYGPTGYGKSHLILRNIHNLNKKIFIITTNGTGEKEFSYVKLYPPITNIPVKLTKPLTFDIQYPPALVQMARTGIYCFDYGTEPPCNPAGAIEATMTWMEKDGITEDPDNLILFISIYHQLKDIEVIRRIEKWMADVIIEHTVSERDIDFELRAVRKSGKWFEVPVLSKQYITDLPEEQIITETTNIRPLRILFGEYVMKNKYDEDAVKHFAKKYNLPLDSLNMAITNGIFDENVFNVAVEIFHPDEKELEYWKKNHYRRNP